MSVVINGQPPVRLVLTQTPGVGAPGVGLPAGGTTGQVLAKNSGTDYDTEWIAASGVGDLLAANNLSELTATAATARTNIGAEAAGAAAAAQSAAIAAAATDATTKANAAQAAAIAASDPAGTASSAVSSHAGTTSGVHGISTFGANLVDDADAATARTTLGLGTAATTAATAYATAAQGATADTAVQPARTISTTAPLTGGGDLSANRTLAVSAATDTAAGVVELATDAETVTGTDTTRATTPAGVAAAIAAGGGGGGWSGHPFVSPTIGGTRRAIWPLGFNSHTTSGLGWQNTRAYAFWLPVERTLTALEYEVTSPSGTGGAVATVGVSPLDENMLGGAATGWGQGSITSTGYKSVAIGVTMPAGWYAVWFRAGQGGCTVRGVNANGPIPAFAGDATTMNGVGGFNQQNWADDSLPVPSNWFNGIGQAWVLSAAPTVQNVALVLDEP